MIQISLDMYSKLTDDVEAALYEADKITNEEVKRITHEEFFVNLRRDL